MRIKQPLDTKWKIGLGTIGILVLVVIYSFLSYRQHHRNPDDTTLPNLSQLLDGFKSVCTHQSNPLAEAFGLEEKPTGAFDHITKTRLFEDGCATYGRLFKGLMWGCVLSIIIGTLMGCFEGVAAFLLPPLALLAKVPGTAMLAVFFVVVGTGEGMFITMIGFGVLPTLTQAIYLSARDDIDRKSVV